MGELPPAVGKRIDIAVAAKILGFDPETVRRWGKLGVLVMIDVGRPGAKRPTYNVYEVQVRFLAQPRVVSDSMSLDDAAADASASD